MSMSIDRRSPGPARALSPNWFDASRAGRSRWKIRHPVKLGRRVYAVAVILGVTGLILFNSLPGYACAATIALMATVFLAPSVGVIIMLKRTDDEERARNAAINEMVAAAGVRRRTHWASWVGRVFLAALGSALIILIVAGATFMLPLAVNDAAYLAGAGQHTVFIPTGSDTCAASGCESSITGYLEGSQAPMRWPGADPTGLPFPVRAPIWDAGSPQITQNRSSAALALMLWPVLSVLEPFVMSWSIVLVQLLFPKRRRRRLRPAPPAT
jgi:hypothetical protein